MYFLIHLKKNACNIQNIQGTFLYSIFWKHYLENILIFNILRKLFGNVPRNFIGNFLQIFWEYIMEMLHEYSTNIYLPGEKKFIVRYISAKENYYNLTKNSRKFQASVTERFTSLSKHSGIFRQKVLNVLAQKLSL